MRVADGLEADEGLDLALDLMPERDARRSKGGAPSDREAVALARVEGETGQRDVVEERLGLGRKPAQPHRRDTPKCPGRAAVEVLRASRLRPSARDAG